MGITGLYGIYLKDKQFPGVLVQGLPPYVSTLSIDLNSVFHSAAQRVYSYGDYEDRGRQRYLRSQTPDKLEKDMFNMIGHMILNIVTTVSPIDAIILAV